MYKNNKVLYIDNCRNEKYMSFVDYAIKSSDYFMLVYINYYSKGLSKTAKEIKKSLKPFQVKKRTNASWPGTPSTYCRDTTYQVIFYKTDTKTTQILKSSNALTAWKNPIFPQDLAFFRGNDCWFYSVTHENIFAFINPSEKDIEFLNTIDLYEEKNHINSAYHYTEDIFSKTKDKDKKTGQKTEDGSLS